VATRELLQRVEGEGDGKTGATDKTREMRAARHG